MTTAIPENINDEARRHILSGRISYNDFSTAQRIVARAIQLERMRCVVVCEDELGADAMKLVRRIQDGEDPRADCAPDANPGISSP